MNATDVQSIDVAQVKEELHRLIDQLPAWEAANALDHVQWLLKDEDDTITEEELALAERDFEEIRRGNYVTLEEINRRYAE